jgi:formate-nitrite transporter family protein
MNDRRTSHSQTGLDDAEREAIREYQRLRAPMIYQIVRAEGEDELSRPVVSLWWSGLAAGLCISLSLFAEGLMHMYLPDEPWRPMVENFGYCMGFLVVILGRMQLFTENTITPILPLIADFNRKTLYCTARLWIVVLLANIAGTLFVAALAVYGELGTTPQLEAAMSIARKALDKSALDAFMHAVPAGFLIAALVWVLPSARGMEFFAIVAITYIIALGDFAHVVVGSTKAFLLVFNGELGLWSCIVEYLLPALAGNIIGGTVLFSLLAYGQVRQEITE